MTSMSVKFFVIFKAHRYYNQYLQMSFPLTVGKYELLQLLGEGTFAIVYKARHIQTGKIVAVKKMKKLNKQDVQMVKKEIEIMKDLKHKNIVEYFTDFRQRQNGDWYIVLEYCGKGDMQKYKKKVGKVPEAHCKLFVRNILQALVELHKRKIAHRDLKLANILINDQYQLKLADFGFSKDYETGYMRSFCGTPLSMAPEILRRQNYNEKCDVWSLGVLTFMMLYNKPPFYPTRTEGMGIPGITNAVTLRHHKFDDSVQVSQICKEFINACLQKQASKRPSTKQLLGHGWFADINNNVNISALRVNAIKNSIKQDDPLKQQASKKCRQMLFGVFQSHLKKASQTMLINVDIIYRLQQIFDEYYPTQTKILECYFLVVIKKLQEIANREVIYVLNNSSYKIQLRQLKKFKEFEHQILHYVENHLKERNITENTKINIEKEIVKFCLNQTELLIECMDDEEIRQKLFLLKTLCKFVTTDYQPTMVDIKWGDRKDMVIYVNYISEYFKQLNQQTITKVINEQHDSDEDLQSTWLIQNHIRQNKLNKNLETELGKLALYVLNIPTNFSSDKFQQTQKIELDQENWLEWMKSQN